MASGPLVTVLEDCLKKINANTAQPVNFLRCVFINTKIVFNKNRHFYFSHLFSILSLDSNDSTGYFQVDSERYW